MRNHHIDLAHLPHRALAGFGVCLSAFTLVLVFSGCSMESDKPYDDIDQAKNGNLEGVWTGRSEFTLGFEIIRIKDTVRITSDSIIALRERSGTDYLYGPSTYVYASKYKRKGDTLRVKMALVKSSRSQSLSYLDSVFVITRLDDEALMFEGTSEQFSFNRLR